MRILGLDPSTTTGWAFITDGVLDVGQFETSEKGFARVEFYYERATSLLDKYKPTMVVIEGYGYGNAFTLVTLAEIGTALRLAGKHHPEACPWVEVSPPTLKKFVTGSGASKKSMMMLEVFKRWAFSPKTDNEADAFALAQMGVAMLGTQTLPKYQQDALKKIRPIV